MRKQRHRYEYKVTPNATGEKVVRMVGANKRVLELGSGPGSITRLMKENGCHVTALELDHKAIELVTQHSERVIRCDLNDPDWPKALSGSDEFEVIVAGDVLEHLYDPWTTLRRVALLLAKNGYIVVSIPHIGHNAVVACLLNEDFEYQPWGLLDKTHIRFFGIKNIQKMFDDSGYKIVEAEFVVKTPEQTEFARCWRKLSPEVRRVLSRNRFGTVYQVVIKAAVKSAPGKGLRLESVAVSAPLAQSFVKRVRSFILSFLNLRTREKISRIFGRAGF